ncbi:MAG: SDR family oxidoreductase [Ignavibacteriaceae bacterium]
MTDFKNKVALITGGGRDIGGEISKKLASLGVKVCYNYFDSDEKGDLTLKTIKASGGEALMVKGDLTKQADIDNLVKSCVDTYGKKIDILVNVTGGLVGRKTVEEMDEKFWDFLMTLNLKTVFMVTKATLPYMSSGGSIVNFSSQAARDGGGPGAIAYATAKGGVLTFTRGLSKELGPKGIRVNAVSPGMIATTFHDTFTKPEVREKVAGSTPLRREGKANEVADLVVYLCSNESSFITGASIEINGGTYFI